MSEISDDDLIRMYREGDADAFDTLFDRYYDRVYNFARTMLHDSHRAEEALQDTFAAVARTAADYTPRGRFHAWLMRIVRNRCLNMIDAQRARPALNGEANVVLLQAASPQPSPLEGTAVNEQTRIIRAAVFELPERQREAIALYAFEQLSYHEISQVLDLPINTVKTLIRRARIALARRLGSVRKEP